MNTSIQTNEPTDPNLQIGTPITIDKSKCLTVSYSSFGMLNSCPRKFSLYKVYPDTEIPRDESAALSQGKAVGHGYATWLETKDMEMAMLETWHHYYPPLEDNVRSITKACVIVQKLAEYDMAGWQLATINGKPCIETSFCIKLAEEELDEDGRIVRPAVYFIGFLDAILHNAAFGRYLPLELKTTTLTANIREMFMNSSQGNGYGLVLDKILGQMGEAIGMNYDIQYMVAQAHKTKADAFNPTIHYGAQFKFTKTIIDRLEWLIDLKTTQQRVQTYTDMAMFPRNGSACLNWNKLCGFSGICTLTNTAKPIWEQNREPNLASFDFSFDIADLIKDAMKLVAEL